jgi:cytochrome c biogenesis protein CcdA
MTPMLAALASAFWLGVLTSISPCPLASNVAAISFVGRSVGRPRRVLAAGAAYSFGRAATYVLVGVLVVSSVLSIPSLSLFLQKRMNQVLGPVLILVGFGLLVRLGLPARSVQWSESVQRRAARRGVLGAGILGMLFALSFCPVSAGLFFGALLPLAASVHSPILMPAVFGLGTGLPVVVFALILALGASWMGRAFRLLTRVETLFRPATGVVFILAGIYLALTHILGFEFGTS